MAGKSLSALVISITPFDEAGNLDEAATHKHFARLREAGVSVYVGGSGGGEGHSLSGDERDLLLRIAVDELKGKVPSVRAQGCEPRVTGEMVEFLRAAERAKVDAAMIFSLDMGHGAKPSAFELDRYYGTVLDAAAIPVCISTHQSAGYILPIELIERLIDRHAQIIGVAYGSTDMIYLARLIERVGDRIEIHGSIPALALSVLGLGANGFMGGEGNFAPALVASVIKSFADGNLPLLQGDFRKLMGLIAITQRYGGGAAMRSMKPLLNAFGLPGGTQRPPRVSISATELGEAVRAVVKLNIPGTPPLLPSFKGS